MSDLSSKERCRCGAALDREKYTICTRCYRSIPPLHPERKHVVRWSYVPEMQ